jgi:N-acetylglucosaminyldiphosphoundecaprenol N-acetyl-beta-D-mannosaminyltransferase
MISPRPRLLGVPTDPLTFDTLFDQMAAWIQAQDRLHQVCTVNPEFLVIAQQDAAFFAVLQVADRCVLDGWGAVLALRWRGIRVPQRVTGSDGVPLLMARAALEGWRVFLLGAAPGVAEKAAQKLRALHPTLQMVGVYAGSPDPAEAEAIIAKINAAQANILLVAYGAPQQDLWINQHRARLQVQVAMGIGGTLDFIAGVIPRAPRWMQKIGLEWLYRLYLQPSRWRRMRRLPLFVCWAWRYGEHSPTHKEAL